MNCSDILTLSRLISFSKNTALYFVCFCMERSNFCEFNCFIFYSHLKVRILLFLYYYNYYYYYYYHYYYCYYYYCYYYFVLFIIGKTSWKLLPESKLAQPALGFENSSIFFVILNNTVFCITSVLILIPIFPMFFSASFVTHPSTPTITRMIFTFRRHHNLAISLFRS